MEKSIKLPFERSIIYAVLFLANGLFQSNVREKSFFFQFDYFFYLGIEECINQKQWIQENEFEIIGSQLEPDSNGSHISRIKHEQNVNRKIQLLSTFLKEQEWAECLSVANRTNTVGATHENFGTDALELQ